MAKSLLEKLKKEKLVLDWRKQQTTRAMVLHDDQGRAGRTSTGVHQGTLRAEVRCGLPALLRGVHGPREERLRGELRTKRLKKKENLPYRVFELSCTMFLHKFTHTGMEAFFCNQMNRHPSEIGMPPGMNRETKFKWLLGQLELWEQRRVLEELCEADDPNVRPEDVEKLRQMLGTSPIQIPTPAQGTLDTRYISEAWQKALDRRHQDPEGAITAARTLLESVCKRILDECGVEYSDNADLPKLYGLTTKELNLAPNQHTEEVFKKILGGAHSVVDGLANLRNRLGDAHGQGKRPVKPLPRHAELAVNMAGSMASFLLATFEAKQ